MRNPTFLRVTCASSRGTNTHLIQPGTGTAKITPHDDARGGRARPEPLTLPDVVEPVEPRLFGTGPVGIVGREVPPLVPANLPAVDPWADTPTKWNNQDV
jgi:hypothetical protein